MFYNTKVRLFRQLNMMNKGKSNVFRIFSHFIKKSYKFAFEIGSENVFPEV